MGFCDAGSDLQVVLTSSQVMGQAEAVVVARMISSSSSLLHGEIPIVAFEADAVPISS